MATALYVYHSNRPEKNNGLIAIFATSQGEIEEEVEEDDNNWGNGEFNNKKMETRSISLWECGCYIELR